MTPEFIIVCMLLAVDVLAWAIAVCLLMYRPETLLTDVMLASAAFNVCQITVLVGIWLQFPTMSVTCAGVIIVSLIFGVAVPIVYLGKSNLRGD